MSQSKTHGRSKLWRTAAEFIVVIVISSLIAYLADYFATKGYIPTDYERPVFAAIVLIGGYIGIRIISAIIQKVAEPSIGITRSHGIRNFFQIVAVLILISSVFGIYGSNLTNVLVGAGFLGIVLGLAAQQVLGNLFGGISLLFSRPFEIGDRVTLATSSYGLFGSTYSHETIPNGYTGTVEEVGIFYTRILLEDGTPSTFPNSVVIGSLIINHSKTSERNVRIRMDVDKRIAFNDFRTELLLALKQVEGAQLTSERTTVEIVDIGISTYQIVISVWSSSEFDESVKTLVIQQAMSVQKEMSKG